jgi:hypothetical protein
MCDHQYSDLSDASRYLVDEPKAFVYLYYTAYRPQKKRGRAKKGEQKVQFDVQAFSRLVNGIDLNQSAGSESHSNSIAQQEAEHDSEAAKKLCQHDVINQAYNALLELLSEQHEENTNLTTEVEITGSRRITFLRDVVRRRKNHQRKRGYDEKVAHEVSPFVNHERLPDIENAMFEHSSTTLLNGTISLRNRFFHLYTTQAVQRAESPFAADLSDLVSFRYHNQREPHPYLFLILQMFEGKTNGDNVLFGRVIRHRLVESCSEGALGLYLLGRFELTGELEDMDFTTNNKWFDVKLLVDLQPPKEGEAVDYTKPLTYTSYTKWQKRLFERLGIRSNHWLHFGRIMGPLALQLEELDDLITKALGNWDPCVFDSRYSSKIPMKGLRVAAGFPQEQGHYVIPRSSCEPPEELKKLIFPCLEQKEEEIKGAESMDNKYRWTAWAFVQLLKELRTIVLQDAAELLLKGRTHAIFELPVFQTTAFLAFKEEMKSALASAPSTNLTAAVDYRMLSAQIASYHATVESARQQDAQQRQAQHQELKNYMNTCMSTLCISVGQSFQAVGQQQLQQLGGTVTAGNPSSVSAGNPSSVSAGNPSSVSAGNPSSVTGGNPSSAATVRPDGDAIATYRPPSKLESVSSFFREWHGEVGTIAKDCGGFKNLEKNTTWRRCWQECEKKRWNRMKKLIEIVERAIVQNPDKPKLHILKFYDEKWQELNGALTTFTTAAEKRGWQIPAAPTVDVHNILAQPSETVEV